MQTRIEKYLFELDCQKCGEKHPLRGELELELIPADDELLEYVRENGNHEKNIVDVDGAPHMWQGVRYSPVLPFECPSCGHVEADVYEREYLTAVLDCGGEIGFAK